jgi:hypothetical protein
MDEMEFERGIWSSALCGDYAEVLRHLEKGENVNRADSSGYTALVILVYGISEVHFALTLSYLFVLLVPYGVISCRTVVFCRKRTIGRHHTRP